MSSSSLKPFNISANIVCKNERYWIEPSILSIVNLVDEIIYVDDDSTDGTLDTVLELAKTYDNIKIFTKEDHGLNKLGDLKNFAKDKSKNELVIRWDADFIAYDSIEKLFEFAIDNISKYDGYVLEGPNLHGDLNHSPTDDEEFGPEVYLFKKNLMKFKPTDRYNDYPFFDKSTRYCRPETTSLSKRFFWIHTNTLKSLTRLAYRKKMSEFNNSGKETSYWKYVNPMMTEEESFEHEIKKVKETPIDVKQFNFEKWGPHPKLLMQHQYAKMFKIKVIDEKTYIDEYPLD